MYFDNWQELWRVVAVGVTSYVAVIVLLRITGKRTLSKMNAFDFIVTVALGSTLATVLLSQTVALAEGTAALALLIVLQFVVAWLGARFRWFRKLVKAQPTLLLHQGRLLNKALVQQRVAPDEIMAAVRSSGYASFAQVEAVVLETDGSFSVIGTTQGHSPTAMANVADFPKD